MKNDMPALPVAVIGGGPIGLAAAAHLVERGFTPLVLEAGESVAAHLESYRHVQLFSPWRYNVDAAARRLLEAHGWNAPDAETLPSAGAMVDEYLAPLARVPELAAAIRLSHRVSAIAREGFDKMKTKGRDGAAFVVRCDTPQGEVELRAWAVIDASGTWGTPNPLGGNGLASIGERENAARIAYGMPDILGRERARYAGKRVLVVGAGHSAAGDLLALAKLADEAPGTRIAWAIRGSNFARIFGGGENDGLAARGALGQRLKRLSESGSLDVQAEFRAERVVREGSTLTVEGRGRNGEARRIAGLDRIIVAAGARPDFGIASELRTKLDPWIECTEALAPLIDPNVHSCGTVRPHGHRELAHPEARFYTVGAKSYGRAPNFLLATGHEQVRSVVAALAGDLAAADDVQLELPETGVCSTQFDEASSGCCTTGTAEPIAVEGAGGCSTGCGTKPAMAEPAKAAPVKAGCCDAKQAAKAVAAGAPCCEASATAAPGTSCCDAAAKDEARKNAACC